MHEQQDYLEAHSEQEPIIPQGINVLTVLSYIGSSFQILGAFVIYSLSAFRHTPLSMLLNWSAEAKLKQFEYRLPILLISLLAAILCIIGANLMRKRQKRGFAVYTVGELMLPVFTAVVIEIWSSVFGLLIAIVFIVLFGFQRKHLTE